MVLSVNYVKIIVCDCSMEYYLQKTYYKTASLISNSCKAIALLAGQTAEVSMLAFEYAKNLVCEFLSFIFFLLYVWSKLSGVISLSSWALSPNRQI